MTVRPFCRELRKLGFKFCFRDRCDGTTLTQFAKREGDRELHVQLWGGGAHRVSHGTYVKLPCGREGLHETTRPTDFHTVPEMLQAIAVEWKRPSTPIPGATLDYSGEDFD